ncbi:MAG TPA: hypothetical protein VF066_01470, partial [Thermoleophilaceae bacterium]
AALVLRPPGQHTDGLAPDEARMKQVGDQMADDTGYTSQYGWQLYDTTGTTEDWTYGAQGAFGYTIEIGPVDGKFHMPYETGVVKEWTGHDGREGRGMRAALLVAAESAANPGDHSVIEGKARKGMTLTLDKKFDTFSSPVCTFAQGVFTSSPDSPVAPLNCVAPGDRQSKPDHLQYTLTVPTNGHYEWHVPPSTRPFVFRHVTPGELEENPYETKKWTAEPADVRPDAQTDCPDDNAACSAERRFAVTEDNTQIKLDLDWTLKPQDFDLELYRVVDGGKLEEVDTSGNPSGVPESVTVTNAPTGEYVARIVYFLTGASQTGNANANDWELTLQRFRKSPDKVETGREEYTLTCSLPNGRVLDSRQVYVERGQRVTEDLCPPSAQAATGGVLGEKVATTNPPRKKTTSKRAICMKKASKIKSKKKRKAAVRRCKTRYPTAAERRAAAKKRAAARKHRRH